MAVRLQEPHSRFCRRAEESGQKADAGAKLRPRFRPCAQEAVELSEAGGRHTSDHEL